MFHWSVCFLDAVFIFHWSLWFVVVDVVAVLFGFLGGFFWGGGGYFSSFRGKGGLGGGEGGLPSSAHAKCVAGMNLLR